MDTLKKNLKEFVTGESKAYYYRITIVLALLGYMITILIILKNGSSWRKGVGMPTDDEYSIAFWAMLTAFAPIGIMIGSWFQYEVWKDGLDDKIYQWQGLVAVILVIGLSIYFAVDFYDVIVHENYEFKNKDISARPYDTDCSNSFATKLSKFSMYQSLALTVVLAVGFIRIKKDRNSLQGTVDSSHGSTE